MYTNVLLWLNRQFRPQNECGESKNYPIYEDSLSACQQQRLIHAQYKKKKKNSLHVIKIVLLILRNCDSDSIEERRNEGKRKPKWREGQK